MTVGEFSPPPNSVTPGTTIAGAATPGTADKARRCRSWIDCLEAGTDIRRIPVESEPESIENCELKIWVSSIAANCLFVVDPKITLFKPSGDNSVPLSNW